MFGEDMKNSLLSCFLTHDVVSEYDHRRSVSPKCMHRSVVRRSQVHHWLSLAATSKLITNVSRCESSFLQSEWIFGRRRLVTVSFKTRIASAPPTSNRRVYMEPERRDTLLRSLEWEDMVTRANGERKSNFHKTAPKTIVHVRYLCLSNSYVRLRIKKY